MKGVAILCSMVYVGLFIASPTIAFNTVKKTPCTSDCWWYNGIDGRYYYCKTNIAPTFWEFCSPPGKTHRQKVCESTCQPPKESRRSSPDSWWCRTRLSYELCSPPDDCEEIPCQNGGTCIQGSIDEVGYTCQCAEGYEGENCNELKVKTCDIFPCVNGGTCFKIAETEEGLMYRCNCAENYEGTNCETRKDFCRSNNVQCHNGGTCNSNFHLHNYECRCLPGYGGQYCEAKIDECASNPCHNNGTCIDLINDYRCICDDTGYQGKTCLEDVNECENEPCLNNSTCTNTKGDYHCSCSGNFNGKLCEKKIKEVVQPPTGDKTFNISELVIIAMAVFTVMAGSFWSGHVKQALRVKKEENKGGCGPLEDKWSFNTSLLLVIIYLFCVCCIAVLLYFFPQSVILHMIVFCAVSSGAIYDCLEPLVRGLPVMSTPIIMYRITIKPKQLFLMLVILGSSVTWFIFRKEDWSWILHDMLGIMVCIFTLKYLRLPNLKICTILFVSWFFCEIFVFIAPLFMKQSKYTMVETASFESSGEQIPFFLKVPHFPARKSYTVFELSGILIPGLLLSYCHSYDLLVGTKYKLYWVISSMAYILGLITTFTSMLLMNSVQSANLYLVPITLIPVIVVATLRGDRVPMWKGHIESSLEVEAKYL